MTRADAKCIALALVRSWDNTITAGLVTDRLTEGRRTATVLVFSRPKQMILGQMVRWRDEEWMLEGLEWSEHGTLATLVQFLPRTQDLIDNEGNHVATVYY